MALNNYTKGLAKLGNIVAETMLQTQMFPSLATRETYVAETNFVNVNIKCFCFKSKKIFCFPDTNFASEAYVAQLATMEAMLTSSRACVTLCQ